MSHFKLFREKVSKVTLATYKNPAQFCRPFSVDEAILFGGYMELADLKVTMAGHSNRACRKLASAYGLLINDFELQLWDRHLLLATTCCKSTRILYRWSH